MDDKELMDIFLKIAIGIIGCIIGGFTVHFHYRSKKTNIKTTITKSGKVYLASGCSVVANDYHPETNLYISGTSSPKLPEPSEQAKSIIMQMVNTGEERLATLEMAGKLEDVHMINTNMPFQTNDGIAVLEGINTLVEQGYLKHSVNNGSSNIYSLTAKGRDYGKKLLEENRGITSI